MIDPADLQNQLTTARDTRDHLDRVITWLEEGVELFAEPQPVLELPAPEPDHQDDHEPDMRRGGGLAGGTGRASRRARPGTCTAPHTADARR